MINNYNFCSLSVTKQFLQMFKQKSLWLGMDCLSIVHCIVKNKLLPNSLSYREFKYSMGVVILQWRRGEGWLLANGAPVSLPPAHEQAPLRHGGGLRCRSRRLRGPRLWYVRLCFPLSYCCEFATLLITFLSASRLNC